MTQMWDISCKVIVKTHGKRNKNLFYLVSQLILPTLLEVSISLPFRHPRPLYSHALFLLVI